MDFIARLFTGPLMFLAGVNHFINPRFYLAIMPPYLPRHRELNYASGAAEIAGAALSMYPPTRRAGGILTILTLIGVFPANVQMAIDAEKFEDKVPGGRAGLYARLPLQAVMLYLVYRATLKRPSA